MVTQVIEGSEAVALAVKICRPDVISAYPISPQTHIVESLARMVADGNLDAQYLRVESEFSAASAVSGASAAGSRAYTASSSQGLLLMTEVLYASAGLRLPFVITGVNRAISAPISIQVDYQDTISLRDAGIIQIYVESSQEAYDTHIAAFKIAEDPGILLPVMVCMDGWILTHSYERVSTLIEDDISNFLPQFQPANMLEVENPKTWGSYAEEDVLMELKYSIHQAMIHAKKRIKEIFSELSLITGRNYGGLIENYRTDDAEIVFVAMSSMTGTIKEAIDTFRADGQRIGLIKVRCYRPFPYEEVIDALKGVKIIVVIEADFSMGSEGALALDLKAKLYGLPKAPTIISIIGGLGGREVNLNTVEKIVRRSRSIQQKGARLNESHWEGLDLSILPEQA